jgi:hypothetical protein
MVGLSPFRDFMKKLSILVPRAEGDLPGLDEGGAHAKQGSFRFGNG